MDHGETEQLDLIRNRAREKAVKELSSRLRQMYATHSAKGILGSGGTLKAGIRVMGDLGSETMAALFADVAEVKRSEASFEIIASTMKDVLDDFGQRLVDLGRMASRAGSSVSMTSTALGLYCEMRSDLEADLLISRNSFLNPAKVQPSEGESSAPIAKNHGGKPLAQHWDRMWAAIAVQLWVGDLKPKKQADIKKAMFDWLNEAGVDAGDSSVTERARALWQAIEQSD